MKGKNIMSIFILGIFLMTSVSANLNCYDSDVTSDFTDGINVYEQSFISYNLEYDEEFQYTHYESCMSDGKLREYFCDGKWAASEFIECENGCSNGVCLKLSEGMICEKDLECESNNCISGECLDKSKFDSLISWLFNKFSKWI